MSLRCSSRATAGLRRSGCTCCGACSTHAIPRRAPAPRSDRTTPSSLSAAGGSRPDSRDAPAAQNTVCVQSAPPCHCGNGGRSLVKVVRANGEPLLHPAPDGTLRYLPGATVRYTGPLDGMGSKSVGLHWHRSAEGAIADARRLIAAGRATCTEFALVRAVACESAVLASDSTAEYVTVSGVHCCELSYVDPCAP